MWIGALCGCVACMLWGLVYLVPLALPGYEPAVIAAGRFIGFGLIAGPLVWIQREEFAHYSRSDWLFVARLGVVGNIVYYICLIHCIQNAGAPLAGMCMSVIPVIVAIVSNLRARRLGRAIAWRRLAPGLMLIAVGLVVGNLTEFARVVEMSQGASGRFWYGVVMGLAAMLIWTWYPIRNADWLLAHPGRSPSAWSTAQGLATLPFAIVMLLVLGSTHGGTGGLLGAEPVKFVLLAAGSGVFCSWLGIVFWNAMSQRLPTAVGGQMIVLESIFAVIYAHIWRAQWPSVTMCAGMTLLIAGVLVSLRAIDRK